MVTFLSFNIGAQCDELLFTEVVNHRENYKVGDATKTYLNYAIEIFNPRNTVVNLSNYSLVGIDVNN